jgi:hypothetical protein
MLFVVYDLAAVLARPLSPSGHKKTSPVSRGGLHVGGDDWNRTNDTRIFSPLLYQLSYITNVLSFKSDAKVNNASYACNTILKIFLLDFLVEVRYHYVLGMHNKWVKR